METNLTATSKGNTVSMVTVSSCRGKKKGWEQERKKSYSQLKAWLLMSNITNVKLLLIIVLTKSSPGKNVSLKVFRNKY